MRALPTDQADKKGSNSVCGFAGLNANNLGNKFRFLPKQLKAKHVPGDLEPDY